MVETWKDWKGKNAQAIEGKKTQNSIDIFSYITEEEYNSTFEKSRIDTVFFILNQNGKLDKDSFRYLEQINSEYHDWIDSEIETFKVELKSLNDKTYREAIQALEEKYQQNTQ